MRTSDTLCVYCQGQLGEPIFQNVRDRLKISSKDWTFRRCCVCGSAVLDPMPSYEELIAAYPEIYAFDQGPKTGLLSQLFYVLETTLFYHPIYRHSVQQTINVTGLRRGRLLDVGGGTGHRTHFFQKTGFRCIVLDMDRRPLRIAKNHFGLTAIQALPENIPIAQGSIDIVTFFHVVEHLRNPISVMHTVHKTLRPDGWCVIVVPLINSGQVRLLGSRWAAVTDAPRHVSLPTSEGIRLLLERSGFRLRLWESVHILDEVGHLSLSLFPSSTSGISCSVPKQILLRMLRIAGGMLTFALLPIAFFIRASLGPSIGIFFGQKS